MWALVPLVFDFKFARWREEKEEKKAFAVNVNIGDGIPL